MVENEIFWGAARDDDCNSLLACTYKPSMWEAEAADTHFRLAWFTKYVSGHIGLHGEFLSQNKTKIEKKKTIQKIKQKKSAKCSGLNL